MTVCVGGYDAPDEVISEEEKQRREVWMDGWNDDREGDRFAEWLAEKEKREVRSNFMIAGMQTWARAIEEDEAFNDFNFQLQ